MNSSLTSYTFETKSLEYVNLRVLAVARVNTMECAF
jgi:hypothetical protein